MESRPTHNQHHPTHASHGEVKHTSKLKCQCFDHPNPLWTLKNLAIGWNDWVQNMGWNSELQKVCILVSTFLDENSDIFKELLLILAYFA